jgi:uncharacterized membrane protein YraQ (UPF0718 family)
MEQLSNAFTLFLSLLVEAIPFLLLGVLVSSLLLVLIDERKLLKLVPKNPVLAALFGSCIGFLFPVCECGNVPVARRLIVKGTPISMAVGFLLAAPTINPIVIWSTWTAFRDQPEVLWLRVGCSLAIATTIGTIFSTQADLRPLLQPAVALGILRREEVVEGVPDLLQGGSFVLGGVGGSSVRLGSKTLDDRRQEVPWQERFNLFIENTLQELQELGGVLILGSALAAAIQTFTPREVILGLGQNSLTSIVAMMALAGLISICSTVDAFFALSFANAFTTGSLVAFLVFGPMFDIKGVGLLLSVFKPKSIAYLLSIAGLMTFAIALFINYNIS